MNSPKSHSVSAGASDSSPTLWLVATPIGNLEDLSPRAIRVLREADLILAEDTRTFGRLAKRFDIETKTLSCFEDNEQGRIPQVLERLTNGDTLALVSEAGTPTISDPGYRLVAACREEGHAVFTVPGPCAAIAALSISGFETDRFSFQGFLPQKSGRRGTALTEALARTEPTIFYESPHRILKTLKQLAEIDSSREVFAARELSKLHEEHLRGVAETLLSSLEERQAIKGEFVLIVRGSGRRNSRK